MQKTENQKIEKNQPKVLRSWAMFDWANSAFALVITAAVFPPYFQQVTDDNLTFLGIEMTNSSLFAFAVSAAYMLIAIVSPWLSGIADAGGRKMFFLRFFTTFGALGCIALVFFDGMDTISLGVIGLVVGMIGFAGGLVFYNAYLPVIATEDNYDRVSARGFAYGYVGSVLLLLLNLAMIMKPELFGLPAEGTLPARIAFGLVGLWWIGFSQIPFKHLPKDLNKGSDKLATMAKQGWKEIKKVWFMLTDQKQVKRFLISFFLYSMGVQTVIFMATTFAEKELALPTSDLIMVVLLLQLVGIGGAYLFAFISERKGNVFSLAIMLVIWTGICIGAYFVQVKNEFFMVAAAVGLVMGGIQALSRSTYSKLLPEETTDTTSYFSFYDVLEKVAIVSGTFIFGLAELLTGNIRSSMLVLSFFFVLSLVMLLRLKVKPADVAV